MEGANMFSSLFIGRESIQTRDLYLALDEIAQKWLECGVV